VTHIPIYGAAMVILTPTSRISPDMIDTSAALDRWVRHADHAAFHEILTAYHPMVLGICQRVLGRCQNADDAMQETFLKLARHAHTIHTHVGSWLYTCALNEARMTLRQNQVRDNNRLMDNDTPAKNHVSNIDHDENELLHHCIAELDEADRDIICLHFFLGLTQEKIAQRYTISQPAVAKRLDRALRYLRIRIVAHGLRVSGIFDTHIAHFSSPLDWRMASLVIAVAGYGTYPPGTIKQAYGLLRNGDVDEPTKRAFENSILSAICLVLTNRQSLSGEPAIWNPYRQSTVSRTQWFAHRITDCAHIVREIGLITWYGVRSVLLPQNKTFARYSWTRDLPRPHSRSLAQK
jgi:RNA polymerase sigma-70 factor, ECF subfamily